MTMRIFGHTRRTRALKRTTGFRFFSLSTLLAAVGVAIVAGAVFFVSVIRSLPSPDQFNAREVSQSTKLYDRTGETLLYEIHGEEKRTLVPFDEIPQYLKDATLAAEDAEFYTQPAFNWRGILRAFIVNLQQGTISQGGSTITQQLVKNVFLTSERTYTRKLKELILAVELESRYSKDEIFGFYLNQIPFGSNAYGVEAAAQTYYGKSVRDISIAEAATLASLLKAPSFYSPWGTHVEELLARKNRVLDRMVELGTLSATDAEKAKSVELSFVPPSLGSIEAPHFVLTVKDYLISRYGESLVTNGGLKVVTTLDTRLQKMAEAAVLKGTERNAELYGSHNAALVAEDPRTGQILALVGSKNYFGDPEPAGCQVAESCSFEGNFDVAAQGLRQPGSALKPFVYMTAFQAGYSPKTVVFDVSTEFDVRGTPATSYRPVNFDGLDHGPVSLESALARSLNIPAVKTLYLAGFDAVLKNLHAFGITTLNERWRYGLSLTLGGGEVRLVDLTNAYATLAQEGVRHTQVSVLRVEDANGTVLEEYRDESERVIDAQFPRQVTQILSDYDLRSPIFGQSNALTVFPDHEVALKTGTSEDHRDAWTVGYTPSLVVGVWAGNNDNTPMIRQGSSILAAVPMWNAFLSDALKLYPTETFTKPDPITLPTKPMLNGQSEFAPIIGGQRYPQIHSILFYVNRSDPTGAVPENPAADQQFMNWEMGVQAWARSHVPQYALYNQPLPESIDFFSASAASTTAAGTVGDATLSITNIRPVSGSFVGTAFTLEADIRSVNGLAKIELSLNGGLVNAFSISSNQFHYSYGHSGPLEPQNRFELRATDTSGKVAAASVILYR
jgi:membrane peptidoglycan carboxypeptidase